MNYLKHYIKLIRKAENRGEMCGYTEKHHIFPRSLCGKNDRLVLLTIREHYIAHLLLWKGLYQRYGRTDGRTIKMFYAIWYMKGRTSCGSSRTYEKLREEFYTIRKDDDQWYKKHMEGRARMKSNPEWQKMMMIRNKEMTKTPKWRENNRKAIEKRNESDQWYKKHMEGRARMKSNPEWQIKQKERNERQKKRYKVWYNSGECEEVLGIYEWCRTRKYDPGALYRVREGKQHKHFDIIRVEEL